MNASSTTVRVSQYIRENLEPLLMKYSVDIALWGHVHNYERTCPVYNEQCIGDVNNPGATIHFVIGMAGQSLTTDWQVPIPTWSEVKALEFGYSRIHVVNNTQLHFQFVLNNNGEVFDDVWISKQPNFTSFGSINL